MCYSPQSGIIGTKKSISKMNNRGYYKHLFINIKVVKQPFTKTLLVFTIVECATLKMTTKSVSSTHKLKHVQPLLPSYPVLYTHTSCLPR